MTVRELLARIDSRELTEWMAFFELEPWGCDVEDERFGVVAATVANVNRDAKKQPRPYTRDDFLPPRDTLQQEEDPETSAAKWREFVDFFKERAAKK